MLISIHFTLRTDLVKRSSTINLLDMCHVRMLNYLRILRYIRRLRISSVINLKKPAYPSTQWADVKTALGATMAPEQSSLRSVVDRIIACHGISAKATSSISKPLGRTTFLEDKKKTVLFRNWKKTHKKMLCIIIVDERSTYLIFQTAMSSWRVWSDNGR